jgi:putative flippase GtrA
MKDAAALTRLFESLRGDSSEYWRVLRFAAVGATNTGLGVLLFAGFYAWLGNSTIAAFAAAVFAILIGFLLTGHAVFGFVSLRSFLLYILWYAALAILNTLTIDAWVRFGVNPYLASALAAPVVTVASYLVNRLLIFRRTGVMDNPAGLREVKRKWDGRR